MPQEMTFEMADPFEKFASITKEYSTPEGDVYVTIAHRSDGPWVNVTVGKGGTQTQANAFAISALVGIALRCGVPSEKLMMALRGITHEDSRSFGLDAKSLPDAVGKALAE